MALIKARIGALVEALNLERPIVFVSSLGDVSDHKSFVLYDGARFVAQQLELAGATKPGHGRALGRWLHRTVEEHGLACTFVVCVG